MQNKPKRGKPWRDASTDSTESANIPLMFKCNKGEIINFITKKRQLAIHNRKDMNKRTQTRKRNIYFEYMEKIYQNDKCILCKEEKQDDRDHYKVCAI